MKETSGIGSACNRTAKWTKATLMLTLSVATIAGVKAEAFAKTASRQVSRSKNRIAQFGRASWYGERFNGHRTAMGERYDVRALTCAHRTLPFGSWVRVTNILNHKAVLVRVNDRGPLSKGLLVDLSLAAAQRIGITGIGPVRMEPLRSNDVEVREYLRPRPAVAAAYLELASNVNGIPLLTPSVALR